VSVVAVELRLVGGESGSPRSPMRWMLRSGRDAARDTNSPRPWTTWCGSGLLADRLPGRWRAAVTNPGTTYVVVDFVLSGGQPRHIGFGLVRDTARDTKRCRRVRLERFPQSARVGIVTGRGVGGWRMAFQTSYAVSIPVARSLSSCLRRNRDLDFAYVAREMLHERTGDAQVSRFVRTMGWRQQSQR
jgi:hypothetical protein